MKLARIMLFTVALSSIIGGILAFKARMPHVVFVHRPEDPVSKCTVALAFYTTTNAGGTLTLATTTSTLPCQQIRIKPTD